MSVLYDNLIRIWKYSNDSSDTMYMAFDGLLHFKFSCDYIYFM